MKGDGRGVRRGTVWAAGTHERGHTFDLVHVTDSLNVMYAAHAGTLLTTQQIDFAFLSNTSSLNSIYGIRNIAPIPTPNASRIR